VISVGDVSRAGTSKLQATVLPEGSTVGGLVAVDVKPL
jgi:hypothetical protein